MLLKKIFPWSKESLRKILKRTRGKCAEKKAENPRLAWNSQNVIIVAVTHIGASNHRIAQMRSERARSIMNSIRWSYMSLRAMMGIEWCVLLNLVLWLTYFTYLWVDFLPQKASHYSATRDTLIRSFSWSQFAIKTQKLFRELFKERSKMFLLYPSVVLLSKLLTRTRPWEHGKKISEFYISYFFCRW